MLQVFGEEVYLWANYNEVGSQLLSISTYALNLKIPTNFACDIYFASIGQQLDIIEINSLHSGICFVLRYYQVCQSISIP